MPGWDQNPGEFFTELIESVLAQTPGEPVTEWTETLEMRKPPHKPDEEEVRVFARKARIDGKIVHQERYFPKAIATPDTTLPVVPRGAATTRGNPRATLRPLPHVPPNPTRMKGIDMPLEERYGSREE